MEIDYLSYLLEERETILNEIIDKIDSLIFINQSLIFLIIIVLILFVALMVYNYD